MISHKWLLGVVMTVLFAVAGAYFAGSNNKVNRHDEQIQELSERTARVEEAITYLKQIIKDDRMYREYVREKN